MALDFLIHDIPVYLLISVIYKHNIQLYLFWPPDNN